MSGFIPTIPQPGDKLAFSQGQLLSNNAALDAVFGIDHFSFSNSTDNSGFHNQVTIPARSGSSTDPLPPTTADTIRLFTKLMGGQPVLYGVRTDGNQVAIEASSNLTDTGFCQLGSLCLKWAKVTSSTTDPLGSESFAYDSTLPFTSKPWLTLVSSANAQGSGPAIYANPDPFNLLTKILINWATNSGATKQFYYLAVGKVI